MDENQQKAQFQHWLPFYVNGRLEEVERAWMQRYLTEHPDAATELHIENLLKSALINELPEFALDQGLNEFMVRLRSETDKATKPAFLQSCKLFMQQCHKAVGPLFSNPRWAMAVLVMLVQTGMIGVLLSQRMLPVPGQTEWRSVGGNTQYQGPVLQVTFKPAATEEDIRLLLVKIRGSLLGGPGQLGHYIVKVPGDNLEAAHKQVLASAIIESVQILPEMPDEN